MSLSRKAAAGAALALSVIFYGCGGSAPSDTPAATAPAHEKFFANMKDLCGATFTGSTEVSSATDPNDAFVVNPLKMHISECTDTQILIPFYVGADSSRTWILTLKSDGLEFKHRHLLPDGTPDEITNYGGMSDGTGNEWSQHFPADAFTAGLNSDYTTNKWSMILHPEENAFEYKLERHAQPRYHARFQKDL